MSETEQDKPTSATPAPEASQPAAAPESQQIAQTSPEEALHAGKQATDTKGIDEGIEMVLTQLKTTLANHGLKEINPAGQPFDPHQHEAISHQPSPDVPAENVAIVVRTGYSLNGRLLRAASVVVSSGPAA